MYQYGMAYVGGLIDFRIMQSNYVCYKVYLPVVI